MGVNSSSDLYDLWVVRKAGKGLTMQAVVLSNKHIRNGTLKSRFIREVDRFEQCLVNDFERGTKSKETVLKALKKEQYDLIEQGKLIGQKGMDLVAGIMQIMTGSVVDYSSATSLCFIGTLTNNDAQIASKSNLKTMPWTKTRKAKQFKLFRYSAEDYLRGYQIPK